MGNGPGSYNPDPFGTGGPDDEEEGGMFVEEGGYDDDEDGGPDDDVDWLVEDGGPDDTPDDLLETGGKKRKKKRFRLFRQKGKKRRRRTQRRRCPPGSGGNGAMFSPTLIEGRGASLKAGIPYISVSSGIKINVSPIPLQERAPRVYVQHGLIQQGIRSGKAPIISTITPAPGVYSLDIQPPVAPGNQYIEASIIVLDIGPQALVTQAGATLTARVTGRYVDNDVADLGEFSFQLPSVVEVMRVIWVLYSLYNGVPVHKLMYASRSYVAPFSGGTGVQAPDSGGNIEEPVIVTGTPVSQVINISGQVPAGLQLTGTIVTPTHPLWSSVAAAVGCNC